MWWVLRLSRVEWFHSLSAGSFIATRIDWSDIIIDGRRLKMMKYSHLVTFVYIEVHPIDDRHHVNFRWTQTSAREWMDGSSGMEKDNTHNLYSLHFWPLDMTNILPFPLLSHPYGPQRAVHPPFLSFDSPEHGIMFFCETYFSSWCHMACNFDHRGCQGKEMMRNQQHMELHLLLKKGYISELR